VWNAASPGIGIAADSRVVIRGIGLAGVPVRLDGREVPIVSSSPTSIEAWLPPGLSPGAHKLQVGAASRSITIARSATGIYESDQTVRRGERISLRITGTVPREVFIGGTAARIVRAVQRGQGIQEIQAVVPENAPEGCAVPVSAEASNFVRVSIGVPCPLPDFLPALTAGPQGLIVAVRNQPDRVFDEAWGWFVRSLTPRLPIPPSGTCTSFLREIDNAPWTGGSDGLSAGPMLYLTSGGERRRVPPLRGTAGMYHAILGGDDGARRSTPLFFRTGPLLFESPGGESVGAFRAVLEPPAPGPAFTLHSTGSRKAGLEVVWSRASGAVVIALRSRDVAAGIQSACLCVAVADAGRFRIPSSRLQVMPSDESGEIFAIQLDTQKWRRVEAAGLVLHTASLTLNSRRIGLE
jgi:hypothetical protein